MLSIIVQPLAGKETELELYASEPISLNLRFLDVTDIARSVGSYSQTIRVPLTDNNRNIFGEVDAVQPVLDSEGAINGKISLRSRLQCRILFDGLIVLRGTLQAKRVVYSALGKPDVEVVIFGDTADLGRQLSAVHLRDLPWSDLDVYLNSFNYYNLNTQPDSALSGIGDGDIRLGPCDKGLGWDFNSPSNSPGAGDGLPVHAAFNAPYVRLRWVLKELATYMGITWQSEWIDDERLDVMYLALPGTTRAGTGTISENRMLVGLPQSVTHTFSLAGPDSTGETFISMYDTTDPFFDLDSQWSTPQTFTAAASGFYTFKVLLNCTLPVTWSVTYHWHKNGEDIGEIGSFAAQSSTGSGAGGVLRANWATKRISMQTGDTLKIRAEIYTGGDTGTATATWVDAGYAGTSSYITNYLEVRYFEQLEDFTLDVGAQVPDRTALDLMTGLQKAFNLVFYFVSDTEVFMEPLVESFENATVLDWSQKLDHSKDIVIEPTTDIQSTEYLFTMTEAPDVANSTVLETFDRVWGRKRILATDNEFAAGTLEVKSSLSPYLTTNVPGGQLPVWRMVTKDGEPIEDPGLYLAYYNGQVPTSNYYYSSTSDREFVGAFSAWDEFQGGVDAYSLGFGAEDNLYSDAYPTTMIPQNSLYNEYWDNWVTTLYSAEARLMHCNLILTATDVASLKRFNKYWLNGQRWVLLELKGYQPGTTSQVKATFFLDLNLNAAEYDARLTPEAPGGDRIITFTDEDGTTGLAGNRKECERVGGSWDGTTCRVPRRLLHAPIRVQSSAVLDHMSVVDSNKGSESSYIVGAQNEAYGTQNLVSGAGNVLDPRTGQSLVVGVGHKTETETLPLAMLGTRALGFNQGLHLGAASRQRHGFHQTGIMTWGAPETTVSRTASDKTFLVYLNGRKGEHLEIPTHACLMMRFYVMLHRTHSSTETRGAAHFDCLLRNDGSVTSVVPSSQPMNPDSNSVVGDFTSGNFELSVDTSTDTSQHRIRVGANVGGTFRATVTGFYTMLLEP